MGVEIQNQTVMLGSRDVRDVIDVSNITLQGTDNTLHKHTPSMLTHAYKEGLLLDHLQVALYK